MLMPTLSITLIGVVIAVVFGSSRRASFWKVAGLGFAGAWAGFLVGALLGVMLDVIANNGIFVVIAGHIVAVAGAFFAIIRFTKTKGKVSQGKS